MSDTTRAILLGFLVLATSIWVGGYVAIAVVAQVATRSLARGDRVAFFRALGRAYGVVSGVALAILLGTGGALLSDRGWDGLSTASVVVAAAVVVSTAVGVVQARRMTRLRHAALHEPDDARLAGAVANGARNAGILRAAIGALSLALIALGSLLAT